MDIHGYRVLNRLGKGTYGYVYRVEKDGKEYALKEQKFGDDEVVPPGFLREVAVIMSARHPYIVRAHRVLYDNSTRRVCTVMDLGVLNLRQWLLRATPTLQEKLSITFQLLCALDFLDRMNIVHGDLKPENILLFADGTIRIADFGFATKLRGQPLSPLIQTVWWRAPEVITSSISGDAQYTQAIDMWSLGVILYEIFTDEQLFTETDPKLLLRLQLETCQKPQVFAYPEVPQLESLVNGCLTIDPTKRLKAATALQSSLFSQWVIAAGHWIDSSRLPTNERGSLTPFTQIQQICNTISAKSSTCVLARQLMWRVAVLQPLMPIDIVACCYIASCLYENVSLSSEEFTLVELRYAVQEISERLGYQFY